MVDTLALFNQAVELFNAGKLVEAEAAFEALLLDDPDDADALFYRAMAKLELGDRPGARRLLELLVDGRDDPTALLELADIEATDGLLVEAREHLERLVAVAPTNAEGHNLLGTVLWEQGEEEPAFKAYLRALELNPWHAGAHYNVGSVCEELGMIDDAIKEYEIYLELTRDAEDRADVEGRITTLQVHRRNLRP